MHIFRAGDIIENADCYNGFHIVKVSNNGWMKIYHPSNVRNNDVTTAYTSVRAHWVLNKRQPYRLIVS